jgi:TRAP-type C4-dicarboxylate transport system substrate-binding protein
MFQKLFNSFVKVLVVVGVLVLVSGSASFAVELKLAHFVSPTHVVTKSVVKPLVDGVAKDSNGSLTIRVYPGGELGAGPMEQYVRALQGVADITWGLQGYTSTQFKKTMIAELPGVRPKGMTGYEMLWNAYEKHLKSEFPGTIPLALYTAEPNIIIMKGRHIKKPKDIVGLKIRVSGSIAGAIVDALGATPVQMPASQVYNALQTGLIDGLITGASMVADFKLDEIADSYTVGVPLGHITFYLVMNQKKYNSLSTEHKAVIDKHSGVGLSRSGEEHWNARAKATIEKIRSTGDNTVIELTKEQAAEFGKKVLPVTDKIVKDLKAEDVLAAMQGK